MDSKLYFSIYNLTKSKIDGKFITDVAEKAFYKLNIKKSAELSLIICGSETIRRLNKIYRKQDKVTDVLAFGLQSSGDLAKEGRRPAFAKATEGRRPAEVRRTKGGLRSSGEEFIQPPDNILHLGDVVVCYQKAKDQARKYSHSFKKEIAYLLIHGILHLVGYDHKKEKDREKMEGMEEKIISQITNPRP